MASPTAPMMLSLMGRRNACGGRRCEAGAQPARPHAPKGVECGFWGAGMGLSGECPGFWSEVIRVLSSSGDRWTQRAGGGGGAWGALVPPWNHATGLYGSSRQPGPRGKSSSGSVWTELASKSVLGSSGGKGSGKAPIKSTTPVGLCFVALWGVVPSVGGGGSPARWA